VAALKMLYLDLILPGTYTYPAANHAPKLVDRMLIYTSGKVTLVDRLSQEVEMNSILLKISVQLFLPPFLAFLSISLFPFCLWITLYISAGQALHRRTQVLFKTARKLCRRKNSGCMMGGKKTKR
jgi:hypothetical protein